MYLGCTQLWITFYVILFTIPALRTTPEGLTPIKQDCVQVDSTSYCMTLYGYPVTWYEAREYCKKQEQHLATLHQEELVVMMENFTQSIRSEDIFHVWVAGRRQSEAIWYNTDHINGTKHLEDGCSDLLYGDKCYRSTEPLTWHEAFQTCTEMESGNFADWNISKQSINVITGSLFPSTDDDFIWVGLISKPWVWTEGGAELFDGPTGPMIIKQIWYSLEDDQIGDVCLALIPNYQGRWSQMHCNDSVEYFICQTEATVEDGFRLIYLVPVVLGPCVIIIVIVVSIVCIRKRKQSRPKEQSSELNKTESSAHYEEAMDQPSNSNTRYTTPANPLFAPSGNDSQHNRRNEQCEGDYVNVKSAIENKASTQKHRLPKKNINVRK